MGGHYRTPLCLRAIFELAGFGAVGDLFTVVPQLLDVSRIEEPDRC